MTANQIKAAEHFERKRSNLRNEQISQGNLDESIRHNKVSEIETKRHNVIGEGLTARDISERERSNRANEGIKRYQTFELSRSNRANERIRTESNRLTSERNAIEEAKRQQDQVTGAVNSVAKIIDAIIPF